MSLENILLGLLARPETGYDLQKVIERSLGHFWHVHIPQIYTTLKRMEQAGLVTAQNVVAKTGPSKRLYQRTPDGRAALVEWLASGPDIQKERRHYLAQVFFLNALQGEEDALEFFKELRARMLARQKILADIETIWQDKFGDQYPDQMPKDEMFRHMTFEWGRTITQPSIDWCTRCIERLEHKKYV